MLNHEEKFLLQIFKRRIESALLQRDRNMPPCEWYVFRNKVVHSSAELVSGNRLFVYGPGDDDGGSTFACGAALALGCLGEAEEEMRGVEHSSLAELFKIFCFETSRFREHARSSEFLELVLKPYRNPKIRGIRGKKGADEEGVAGYSDRG